MVGKLQDIVTAAVIVGATEKVNIGNRVGNHNQRQNVQSESNEVQKVGQSEGRFVVDVQGMEPEENTLYQQEQEEEFHLEPGSLDEETVSLMTKELNELMNKINCNLEFNYHKEVNVMSVKMIDKETQEVIKELPPEEMIENLIKAKDWLGAFIDKNI